MSHTMVFEPDGRRVPLKIGSSIMEMARQAGVSVNTECGGGGTCGKCRVIVKDQSNASTVTETERELLTSEEIAQGYRLACQTEVFGDLVVYIPRPLSGERRIQVGGLERDVPLLPLVSRQDIKLPRPVLEDPLADAERLIRVLKAKGIEVESIRLPVLRGLAATLRSSDWKITVTTWNGEIVQVEGGCSGRPPYGLAVDIGTSKVVMLLVNLGDGLIESAASQENPQMIHGEDVYTRMTYAIEGSKSTEELADLVVGCMNSLISELEEKVGVDRSDILETTVVGNTAMHHLLLGLSTKSLAFSPFVPTIRRGYNVRAQSLGLKISPEANVYSFPVIAGFVGGDAVADILSTGISESEELRMLVDIGTNTEIALGNRDDLLCCSCASGPAFEGYHITHGVKAVSGAIERVQIDPESYLVSYKTINGARPVGICGSGMIDVVAEMLKASLIRPDGRFNPEFMDRFHHRKEMLEFTIVPASSSATNTDIVLSQKDVRELQLAKAAIYTGCKALMDEKNVSVDEVRTAYIAGAFGNYLDLQNAIAIGMLPSIPVKRFVLVGNSAVTGAKLGLISSEMREKAERIAEMTRYLELGARKTFNRDFTAALNFPKDY